MAGKAVQFDSRFAENCIIVGAIVVEIWVGLWRSKQRMVSSSRCGAENGWLSLWRTVVRLLSPFICSHRTPQPFINLPGPFTYRAHTLFWVRYSLPKPVQSRAPIVYKEDVVLAGAMSRETEVTIVRRANSRNIVYLRYDYAVFGESRVRWTAFPVICIVFLYIGWITKMLQVFFVWPLVRLGQNNAYGKKGG